MRLAESRRKGDHKLFSGLIRIHVLYHASKEPIFGLGMIEKLQGHGYKLSAGTMYPLLHGLEEGVSTLERHSIGQSGAPTLPGDAGRAQGAR